MPFAENPTKTSARCFAIIEKECILHSDGSELNFNDLLDFKRRYQNADFIEETEKNKEGGQPPYASNSTSVSFSSIHRAGAAAPATPPRR